MSGQELIQVVPSVLVLLLALGVVALGVVAWQFASMESERRRFNRERKQLAGTINDPAATYLAKAEAGIELYQLSDPLAEKLRADARARDMVGGDDT